MAVVEVSYGMTIVEVGLVVSVVPIPVITTEVTPSATLVADTSFPTGIEVTATNVDVTGGTVLYHYVRTRSHNVWATHLVVTSAAHLHASVVMHYHLAVMTARVESVTTSAMISTSATLSIYVNTCHAHHGCHYHHHVEIVALHNRIVLNVCKSVLFSCLQWQRYSIYQRGKTDNP